MSIQLKSPRLSISPLEFSDLEDVHQLHLLPETDKYNTLGIPESLEQTEQIVTAWVKENETPDDNRTFKIHLRSDAAFIGLIALAMGKPKFRSAEVWLKLHPNHWNQGYATEALKTLIAFGFETLDLHRIEAGCAVDNVGSAQVLLKAGMQQEGTKRSVLPLKSGWSDAHIFAIIREDS
ncbi:Protein N-acetyltransferase, RimJ/RimL family [Robiginitalea myxolifaciens]|uniref:Protein N-acetyltransferase, RimJ/RimL family n=1 Tax=Robiginitalea myxolifaciens TaxID=400055 RepID=A0A1I6HC03_9FLAO|nr:GNAT family N-acetyltransferase [Robiginitalea myxolifaciens]SFR51969.1 Protein N-acetyltransferase, RimJ/RimL family [Robiginitalea myxolifaciens]